ncbi:MAG: GNAT family N-acetyltransferase [Lentisphaeria bacterium]|nr:GNAT family N-acetyltransferase [Lentisphaeria bacterium]
MNGNERRNEGLHAEAVRPCAELLDAYLDFCRETWGHVHDPYILHDPALYAQWRETIFEDYRRQEAGIGLAPGIVPSVTYWIRSGDRIIGAANIRPELNDALRDYGGHLGLVIRPGERGKGYGWGILPQLAELARGLGVRELLLTCEGSNRASLRHLESIPGARQESADGVVNGRRCRIHRTWLKLIGG